MDHRYWKVLGMAWLGLSLAACGDEAPRAKPGTSGEDIRSALGALGGAKVLGTQVEGVIPDTIRGELAHVERGRAGLSAEQSLAPALAAVAPVFRLSPKDLVFRKASTDAQGNEHLRYQQTKNGLEVVGGNLLVHVRRDGTVYMANGSARDGVNLSARPSVAASSASAAALRATHGTDLSLKGTPRLVYLRTEDGQLRLAWETRVVGQGEGMPLRDRVYVSAADGAVLLRVPEIHSALNREVYDGHGLLLPGELMRAEADAPTGDTTADTNFDMLGYTYRCYQENFGRDSYDNEGHTYVSSVHYGFNFVNAFWDGEQMVYGDGDGVNSGPLGRDGDVTVHELTHAVTQNESNLLYFGQSGGLNEAMSDTFSAVCESWKSGTWSTDADIWKIGEDIWTPAVPGDALRYMDDPFADGDSLDYAPDFSSGTDPHYSSGIPNLAFALLSKGGTHPRGRSTVQVPGIGVEKAAHIWYYANTVFYSELTTFEQARAWTMLAAADLGYDQATQDAVKAAWDAVGVGVVLPPPESIALVNGESVTGSDSEIGHGTLYSLDVPANTPVTFAITGGTGDADLYVRFGAAPTSDAYDCRPYLNGSSEVCFMAPRSTAGTFYVMLRGYPTYSNVRLTGQF
ncbi:M4 family metallopeptidase [Myxococcaceae bacterium JPH2]|nr:M4 family metallopeptidase [Myxococcaceae bacterium JPH2]